MFDTRLAASDNDPIAKLRKVKVETDPALSHSFPPFLSSSSKTTNFLPELGQNDPDVPDKKWHPAN